MIIFVPVSFGFYIVLLHWKHTQIKYYITEESLDRVKGIWNLSPLRAAKVQASLRIRAVSPEPSLLAHTSSESGRTFRQKARSLAPLNGWACAVEICHDGMLEDTNSLDAAHFKLLVYAGSLLLTSILPIRIYGIDFQFSRYNANMMDRSIWYEIYWKQLRTQHLTISSWVYFISLKKAYDRNIQTWVD